MVVEKDIRRLTGTDAGLVREIMGEAFAEDPVMAYMQPDGVIIGGYFEAVFRKHYLKHGLSHITRDHTGVALWLPPGAKAMFPPLSYISAWTWGFLRRRRGARRIVRAFRALYNVDWSRPKEPHYYLHGLGVVGNSRGRGVGSVLLRKTLAVCDRERTMAWLECSSEKNLPLYNRHGFRVVGDYRVAPGGPMIWFMKRSPE